ncbi:MAG TPA: glycoside hydrolase family 3 protein [bacterium]|nr:glycoside hydrolase family 3 protein [bacterium]HOL46698.1 glycoside hydrolase family 3 protein [bacterium]HPQ18386.1 glycoside hydrolase family 3 protein [bacterium]
MEDIKKKIGQMLIVGFRGFELNKENHIYKDIKNNNIGGVVIFELDGPAGKRPRNIISKEQLKKLIFNLQDLSEKKLFIAIDEEGGNVNRLKEEYGFEKFLSAQEISALNNEKLAEENFLKIAIALRDVGINLNFAPVVDVNINPDCPVIGAKKRSYSNLPEIVCKYAELFIEAHHKNGILTTLKHFPGHGSSLTDSHIGFVDITNTWKEEELIPYQELIKKGKCNLIMTGHLYNKKLDEEYPATLSKKIINNLLREKIGWQGLIISDDLQMKAISDFFGLEKAIELAINAGIDLLLFSNNTTFYDDYIVEKVISIILKLIKEGRIKEEQIEKAYKNIMLAKKKLVN